MSVHSMPVRRGGLPRTVCLARALWLGLLGALLAAAPVAAQQQSASGAAPRPRVAILEFQRIGVTEAEGAAITDRLRTDFVNLHIYQVLDRAQMEAVLQEQAFQQEGVTDPNQAVRIGKLLNVEYIVTGRVTKLAQAYQVNAQMIRVETAEVIRSETLLHRGDIIGLLSENMATVASRLAEAGAGKAAPKATVTPEAKAPPPAEAPPAEMGPSSWPLIAGGVALGLGALMELNAVSQSSDAVDKADTARSTGDTALYNDATSQQDSAKSMETLAFAAMGVGVALLVYYSMQDAPAQKNAAAPAPEPLPVRIEVQPRAVAVSYALRW